MSWAWWVYLRSVHGAGYKFEEKTCSCCKKLTNPGFYRRQTGLLHVECVQGPWSACLAESAQPQPFRKIMSLVLAFFLLSIIPFLAGALSKLVTAHCKRQCRDLVIYAFHSTSMYKLGTSSNEQPCSLKIDVWELICKHVLFFHATYWGIEHQFSWQNS